MATCVASALLRAYWNGRSYSLTSITKLMHAKNEKAMRDRRLHKRTVDSFETPTLLPTPPPLSLSLFLHLYPSSILSPWHPEPIWALLLSYSDTFLWSSWHLCGPWRRGDWARPRAIFSTGAGYTTSHTLRTTRRVVLLIDPSSIAPTTGAPISCTLSTDGVPMAATSQGESPILSLSLNFYIYIEVFEILRGN